VIDSRHPHCSTLHHFRQRLIVNIGAMLDGVGAGPDRIGDA
jgi:hypothetical protein